MSLYKKYVIFAAISIVFNLLSQHLSILAYSGPYSIVLSMVIGTGVGLVVKYWLDKNYIFSYQSDNLSHDSKLFLLYSLMGVVTTVIFWGFEFAFEYAFDSHLMRYVGGAIGLTIGYIIKYQLDKRYVFV